MEYLEGDAKLMFIKIINEIENIPLTESKVLVVVEEYGYGLLWELKMKQMIDFELKDEIPSDSLPGDPPSVKQKLYSVIISFRKQDNEIYIKTTDNKEIKYYITETGRPIWNW